jgi:hypothetical protein
MSGWRLFWTLVGFLVFIIVLIFLYFYKPFEDLFRLIVDGLSFDNSIFWVALVIGIIGFCSYHWRAYQLYIVQQGNVEAVVLSSLQGSTFIAILLSAGAALQAVQSMSVYLLRQAELDSGFGDRLAAVVTLVIVTAVFCIIFWLLKIAHAARKHA